MDATSGVVYWMDSALKQIRRARIPTNPLDLAIPQTVVNLPENAEEPEGIAYDWLGK